VGSNLGPSGGSEGGREKLIRLDSARRSASNKYEGTLPAEIEMTPALSIQSKNGKKKKKTGGEGRTAAAQKVGM